jgi:hypothetical protein
MRLLTLALITFILFFSSCSNDQENKNAVSLEGKWEYQLLGTLVENNEILEDYEHSELCSKDFMVLGTGGSYQNHLFEHNGIGCETNIENGNWQKLENHLILSLNGEVLSAEIIRLEKHLLKLRISIFDDEENMNLIFIYQFRRV